jgi:hypothetical protein
MQNYNNFQKILHELCLGKKFIKKSLYEIEKIIFYRKNDWVKSSNHVFITGLPRSGTTALLNFIYLSDQFSSFLYEDMPFIMAPNIYSKIYKKKEIIRTERFHGDGILFDLNSPEAFDEVFFLTFNNEEIKKELVKFISLILKKNNKKRYLSKNNFNYKRISLLSTIFPNSTYLIPFRDPIKHSYSLLSQHLRFLKIQKENSFVLKYMNFLGHVEFGINHKSWNISKTNLKFSDINYWLDQWFIFYSDLFTKIHKVKNLYFICYEKLNDENYINKLKKKIELKSENNFNFKNSDNKISETIDTVILNRANELYKKLEIESRKLLI